MEHHPTRSPASGDAIPEVLRLWLRAFRPHVTGPTWQNLLVLVMGALLAPGKRTVSTCLRIGVGDRASPRAASTATPRAPATAISSRPAACAG
jgi:hypothetical protein